MAEARDEAVAEARDEAVAEARDEAVAEARDEAVAEAHSTRLQGWGYRAEASTCFHFPYFDYSIQGRACDQLTGARHCERLDHAGLQWQQPVQLLEPRFPQQNLPVLSWHR